MSTVSNTQRNGHAQFLDAIMIYQSFSGDADSGNSRFTMNGGSLTNRQGHLFHVTNTNAIITLNGVKLVNDDPAKVLLSVCADGWQGATNKATLNVSRQQLEGTILVGGDSELTLTLADGSAFNGCIGGNITNAAGESVSTETGTVHVTLGNGCTYYGRQVPKHAHGTANLDRQTSSSSIIAKAVGELYDRIVNPDLLIRRINLTANHVVNEASVRQHEPPQQLDLFTNYEEVERKRKEEREALEKERRMQEARLAIKRRFGKNAILKGLNFEEGATAKERNAQIGGHKA